MFATTLGSLPALMGEVNFQPQHKDDFAEIYDLEDPSPYFRALHGVDYRMPEVLAGFLRLARESLLRARGHTGELRVLDFACSYGVNGASGVADFKVADRGNPQNRWSWAHVSEAGEQ